MKKVIYGYHVEDPKAKLYFFNYNDDVIYNYQLEECGYAYAIAKTSKGLSLIKVCGYGKMTDDWHIAHRKVIKLIHIEETGETENDDK